MMPFWYEIVVWVWYLGLLLSQITNPGAKALWIIWPLS